MLTATPPPFQPDRAPADPGALFVDRLDDAIAAGVPEPHAMTLATTGEDGLPDARILILKDLDEAGWHLAVQAESAKGRQLAARPAAALTFYWPERGRQVRVRGVTTPDPESVRVADFLARSASARALAIRGGQSRPMEPGAPGPAEGSAADAVSPGWRSLALTPSSVEFWQADPDRRHLRLRYGRTSGATTWTRVVLQP